MPACAIAYVFCRNPSAVNKKYARVPTYLPHTTKPSTCGSFTRRSVALPPRTRAKRPVARWRQGEQCRDSRDVGVGGGSGTQSDTPAQRRRDRAISHIGAALEGLERGIASEIVLASVAGACSILLEQTNCNEGPITPCDCQLRLGLHGCLVRPYSRGAGPGVRLAPWGCGFDDWCGGALVTAKEQNKRAGAGTWPGNIGCVVGDADDRF
jgi:hypothetical protein